MFFIKDAYATVWKVEDKGNYISGRLTTGEKDKNNPGKYINSNWNVKFLGKSKDMALNLVEREKIKIVSGKITNTLYEDKKDGSKKSFLDVVIFEFESPEAPSKPVENSVSDSDNQLPF